MKHLFLITSFWIAIIVSASAASHTLYVGSCYEYTSIFGYMPHTFSLVYNDKTKFIELQTSGNIKTTYVDLQWYDIKQINKILEKYFEWEKLALEKEVELDKELPGSPIKTKVKWEELDSYYSSSNFIIHFSFFSLDKENHCFAVGTEKVSGPYNVSTCSFYFLFGKNQAEDFYSGINEENLRKQVLEIEKTNERNKEIEDSLFN